MAPPCGSQRGPKLGSLPIVVDRAHLFEQKSRRGAAEARAATDDQGLWSALDVTSVKEFSR
jgi:hypothetical protein